LLGTRASRAIRWIARGWSLLVAGFVVFMILSPDPYATEPVPAEDWLLLGFWGVAVLGLLIAWRWELQGAVITLASIFLRELAWVLIKGGWMVEFLIAWLFLKGGWMVEFLIAWLFLAPPAVLYLLAGSKAKPAKGLPGKASE